MTIHHTLDAIPLWILRVLTTLLFLVALELGFRLGRYRRRMPETEDEGPSGSVVGGALGLLGFMLAFTFSMAGDRFATRKQLVLAEANAIGTAFLRARLLPEPASVEIQDLLREYVNVRLLGAEQPGDTQRMSNEEAIRDAIIASEKLQRDLWSRTEALAQTDARSIAIGLFVESLNEVIDLHSVRVTTGIRFRIPMIIWITLCLLAFLSMVVMGFHGGLASPRRSVGTLFLTLAFVLVLSLIIDLDRGQEGFLQVGQDPLFDVRNSMESVPR